MGAADREGEGVGCIFGFGWFGEAQEGLNHFLNLGFRGVAGAHDGELGAFGGVFVDGDGVAGSCEENHPFGHAELNGALDVFHHELGLDGDGVGLMASDEGFDAVKNNFISFGKGEFGRGADAAKVDWLDVLIDDAVPGNDCSRINSQNFLHNTCFTRVGCLCII